MPGRLLPVRLAAAVWLVGITTLSAGQDVKPVPKDSVRLVVTGCLKGRVLAAVEHAEPETAGPDVSGRTFRLSGPRAVMDDVKRYNRQLVEVVGVVKKTDLAATRTGAMIGRTRVVIGAPMSSDPTRNPARSPDATYVVMDVSSVRFLTETCPLR